MKKALIVLVVIAAILAALFFAFQTKEGPIQLAYKFKQGQVDKYKTSTSVKMDAAGFFGSGGPSTQKMTMTTTQKVLKVNNDGSARIEFDARVTRGGYGGAFMSPPMPHGAYALTVAKTGKPVDTKELKKLMMDRGGMPAFDSMPSSSIGVGIVLPERGVGVGQQWTEKTPFPMGGGAITDNATLIADDYKLGSRKVCKIEHRYDGKIDLRELCKSMPKGRMMPFDISGEMTLTGTGTVYFSRQEGKVVRSTDNGKVVMKMVMGRAPGSGSSSTGAAMTIEMVAETKSVTNLVEKKKGS